MWLAAVMVVVVLVATAIANLGYGDEVFAFLKYVPGGDLTGHFLIYTALSLAVCASLSGVARLWTAGVLVVAVCLEELSQAAIASRTFSWLDMVASVAGVLAGLLGAQVLRSRSWKQSTSITPKASDD